MQENNLTQSRKTIWGVSLVVFFVILVITFILIRFFVLNVYENKDDLEKNKMVLDAINQDSSNLEQYEKLTEKIVLNKDLLDSSAITNDNLVVFIRNLESIAKETKNTITIASYQPSKKKPTPADSNSSQSSSNGTAGADQSNQEQKREYLMLTVEGNYVKFLNFFHKLENINYMFQIDSLETSLKDKPVSEEKIADFQKNPLVSKILISFTFQDKK